MEVRALVTALLKGVGGLVRPAGAALMAAAVLTASNARGQINPAHVNIRIDVQGIAGVSDLVALTGSAPGEINLTWTEPSRTGTTGPHAYEMRVSTLANIDDNAAFLAAQALSVFSSSPLPVPGAGGGQLATVVTGLVPGIVHYFALREKDSLSAVGTWTRSNGWSQTNFALSNAESPVPITDLTGLAGPGEGQVSLAWTAPVPPILVSYRIFHTTFSVASVGGSTTAWRAAAL
ncbi:MAG: hypothetical protein COV48_10525, partial [Elusimicrobia bacterium CG11_big_fil_rev_8_21_14_0_20_64_6]